MHRTEAAAVTHLTEEEAELARKKALQSAFGGKGGALRRFLLCRNSTCSFQIYILITHIYRSSIEILEHVLC